jgi:hypothetical protein
VGSNSSSAVSVEIVAATTLTAQSILRGADYKFPGDYLNIAAASYIGGRTFVYALTHGGGIVNSTKKTKTSIFISPADSVKVGASTID